MDIAINQIKDLISQGRYLEAHNGTIDSLQEDPDNLHLKQLHALSLAKSGGLEEAQKYLEPIYDQNKNDAETAGILGGIYKGIFRNTENTQYAIRSRDVYLNNYHDTGDYYTGINAATMSMIMGDFAKSKSVVKIVLEGLEKEENNVWVEATRAEAYLLLKDIDSSIKHYNNARQMASNNWGQVNSIYQQLWLLNHYRRVPAEILKIFQPPVITAFAGHMIDNPINNGVRFPEEIVKQVSEAIASEIERLNIKIGYCSLACGADILFAEAMIKAGNEINISLPFDQNDFIKTSVGFASDYWTERFSAIMRSQKVKFITKENYLKDDVLFALQGKVIFGSAILRSSTFNSTPYLLTVLSASDKKRAIGGTRTLHDLWPYKETEVNINPDEFHNNYRESTNNGSKAVNESTEEISVHRNILCMLYAEVVGYDQIEEGNKPYFAHKVWGEIADNFDELLIQPTFLNIWAGKLFSVFSSTRSAIEFALYMKKIVKGFDWEKAGLPNGIELKLGLHIGPAYYGINPLTKQNNVYGSHINRAMKILNITISGAIYASEQFASVLALESNEYQFDPVGVVKLDNELGTQEIYKISDSKK